MNIIRSRQHEIFTETVNKIALSANDDKRIILPDRINTHAWGYLSKKYKYSWSQRDINMGVKYYFPLTPRTCRGQRGGPRTYIMTLLWKNRGVVFFKRYEKKHHKGTLTTKMPFAARFSCCATIDFNSISKYLRRGCDNKFHIKIFGICLTIDLWKNRGGNFF